MSTDELMPQMPDFPGLGNYILTPDKIPLAAGLIQAARWRDSEFRKPNGGLARVGFTRIPGFGFVSTVFLGLDHGHGFLRGADTSKNPGGYRPVLFETMAFGGKRRIKMFGRRRTIHPEYGQWRYCTWAEAEAGHKRVVQAYRRLGKALMRAYAAGDKRALWSLERLAYTLASAE